MNSLMKRVKFFEYLLSLIIEIRCYFYKNNTSRRIAFGSIWEYFELFAKNHQLVASNGEIKIEIFYRTSTFYLCDENGFLLFLNGILFYFV